MIALSPDYQEPMLGVLFSGIALLAIIAVPIVILEWRSIREWWRDVSGPLP